MTIVRCPRCRDEVTVPPRAGGGALVRCPLCLEQYLLSEAIAQMPPALVMVSENIRDGFAAPVVEETEVPAGDEYLLSGVGTAPLVTPTTRDALAAATALRLSRRPRSAQRETHFLVEMAKVTLGGIAGLLLGLLVLWWAFRTDPLELGPSVARQVPWIVPASLQGKSKAPQMSVVQAKAAPSVSPPQQEKIAEAPPEESSIREGALGEGMPHQAMPDLTDLLPDSTDP
jgi:hypothetical protein